LHFFDLGTFESDSLPIINTVTNFLFRVYEKDFMSAYYSGKDSSYDYGNDQYGNFKMKSSDPHEYIVNVYDENGNILPQRTSPYTFNLNEISLFFDKKASSQHVRTIYPGANFPIITDSGINLGNINSYLSNLVLKRFSQTSQTLIDYLIQIYN
jgi:hypothetical protein